MSATLTYFSIRGKSEVAKLLLALAKTDYKLKSVQLGEYKDLTQFPFAQVPRYQDEQVDIVQSNSIIRYLAKKAKMYGNGIAEEAQVDVILEAVEDFRAKYVDLIYGAQLAPAAKDAFYALHIAAEGLEKRNSGANLGYFNRALVKSGGKTFVGSSLTAADLAVYDIVDLCTRIWPSETIAALHPELIAHLAFVESQPLIKEYLASPLRLVACNNNGLGN